MAREPAAPPGAEPTEPGAEPSEPRAEPSELRAGRRGGGAGPRRGPAEVPPGPPLPPRRGTLAQLAASSSHCNRLVDQVPPRPQHLIRRGGPRSASDCLRPCFLSLPLPLPPSLTPFRCHRRGRRLRGVGGGRWGTGTAQVKTASEEGAGVGASPAGPAGGEAGARARLVSKALVWTVELGEGRRRPRERRRARERWRGRDRSPQYRGGRVYGDPASCAGSVAPERR